MATFGLIHVYVQLRVEIFRGEMGSTAGKCPHPFCCVVLKKEGAAYLMSVVFKKKLLLGKLYKKLK